ncbi:MAG: hypothetical protein ACTHL1_03090, partial [Burkholderiaceae bacterium]
MPHRRTLPDPGLHTASPANPSPSFLVAKRPAGENSGFARFFRMQIASILVPDFTMILIGFILIRITDWGDAFWVGLEK